MLIQLFNKYKKIVMYLVFGVLTTIVNYFVYFTLTRFTPIQYVNANVIAWAASVLFAYWTNRSWVFNSTVHKWSQVLREFFSFVSARLLSGLIDTALLYVLVDWLSVNDMTAKVFISILVIVLNYIFSKFFVFAKR